MEIITKKLTNGRITRRQNIIRLPYVPFANLIDLIRGAKTVFFPSIYEGFGLPIIEAMLCKTPVITSKYGATAEIAGDAAILVDPYDINEMATTIRHIMERDVRVDLSDAMERRVAFFSSGEQEKRLNDALRF